MHSRASLSRRARDPLGLRRPENPLHRSASFTNCPRDKKRHALHDLLAEPGSLPRYESISLTRAGRLAGVDLSVPVLWKDCGLLPPASQSHNLAFLAGRNSYPDRPARRHDRVGRADDGNWQGKARPTRPRRDGPLQLLDRASAWCGPNAPVSNRLRPNRRPGSRMPGRLVGASAITKSKKRFFVRFGRALDPTTGGRAHLTGCPGGISRGRRQPIFISHMSNITNTIKSACGRAKKNPRISVAERF